jgi:tetratricopeptide (TPR) repeat protein
MHSAQAQLADAYLAAGAAAEARFISEDLVAREPWERANIERFRRALELLGEPDPDTLIAERLSGHSPFTSTDLSLDLGDLSAPEPMSPSEDRSEAPPPQEETVPPWPPAAAEADKTDESWTSTPSAAAPARGNGPQKPADEGRDHFELSSNAIDLQSILGELESSSRSAHSASENVEVNLNAGLDDLNRPRPPAQSAPPQGADLDGVFEHLRDDAGRRSQMDTAEEQYRRALFLKEAGDLDGCILALQAASRAPRLRFVTASLLGRVYRDRGMMPQAVESFERAAQAPAPSTDESYALLYDLADALENEGETARALAISLELQSEAGVYRDIAERIDRLTKVQARG